MSTLNADFQRVLVAEFDGESVLLNVEMGQYYSVNETGLLIWKLLQAGFTPEGVAHEFVNAYHVSFDQAQTDVIAMALGFAIVRTTLAEALAPHETALALWFNPGLSAAHRVEAARLLRAQGSEEKVTDQVRLQGGAPNLAIEAHLSRAVARAPASAATAALYATLAEQRGDATTAREWHRRAAALHVHHEDSRILNLA